MKFVRIFLLALIVIGIGLLATQSFWVPPFVNWIYVSEYKIQTVQPVSIQATTTSVAHPKPPSPALKETGTLFGSVTLSPTCPVERIPPDPQCSPKPYVTTVKVLHTGSANVVASAESASDGTFKFTLAPGMYEVEAEGATVYPRCSPVNTQIITGTSTTITIACDTGIR